MCVHVYLLVTAVCTKIHMCNVATTFFGVYVKHVYSAHCHMVDCSDVIFGTYMCIHLPYRSLRYLAYMAYMPNLVGIFVSSTYLALTWEVHTTIGCVLSHMCKNIGSIYPFNMLEVWLTYAVWLSYIFSNIYAYVELYIDSCYTRIPLFI